MKKIAILGTIVAVLLAGAFFGVRAFAAGTQGPYCTPADGGNNGCGYCPGAGPAGAAGATGQSYEPGYGRGMMGRFGRTS